METLFLDKENLKIDELVCAARNQPRVDVSPACEERITKARNLIDRWVKDKKVIYGITTGFGAMCNVTIPAEDTRELQKNILMSHAAGVGEPFPVDVVRAIMALRIHDLSMGYSACGIEIIRYLLKFLNEGVTPVVPRKGSVGASGDLAPTAHLGLVLIGKGEAFYQNQRLSGAEALKKLDLLPLQLEAGEGLGLINGTQVMTGLGALVVYDSIRLSKMADIACAMSLEVLMGSQSQFDHRIHQVRPHPGQIATAENMLQLTKNSEIIASHQGCSRVQDAYTLRCSPQIHGASKDAIAHAKRVIDIEINSTTTNPLVFTEIEDIRLGGNFHGQPVAMAADYLQR